MFDAAPACDEDNVLAAFLGGKLDEVAAARVEAHLDICRGCRAVVADFARNFVETGPSSGVSTGERDVDRLRKGRKSLKPGRKLGRYALVSPLGSGGMSRVYLARDEVLERSVALKVIDLPDHDEGATARKFLLHEARAAAAMVHPNVVTVHDVFEHEGITCIVMEVVDGEPMSSLVGDESIPLERRICWLADVARTLAAAHARGLVHRDVKPANVMVQGDGSIKVVDFGIAHRPLVRSASSTLLDLSKAGTPRYMAPEQLRGEPVDERVDQFAWAVLAYELLSGRSPWSANADVLTLASQILSTDPAPLRAIAPRVPLSVTKTVERAMAKDPRGRFATMESLAASFASDAQTFGSPSVKSRPSRFVPILGVIAALAGAAFVVRSARPSGRAAGRLEAPPPEPASSIRSNAVAIDSAEAPPNAPAIASTLKLGRAPRSSTPSAHKEPPSAPVAPQAPEPAAAIRAVPPPPPDPLERRK